MVTVALKPVSTTASIVGEFVIEARLEALNAELLARGLDANRVITIFEMPAQPIASGYPARYRVLYRQP